MPKTMKAKYVVVTSSEIRPDGTRYAELAFVKGGTDSKTEVNQSGSIYLYVHPDVVFDYALGSFVDVTFKASKAPKVPK